MENNALPYLARLVALDKPFLTLEFDNGASVRVAVSNTVFSEVCRAMSGTRSKIEWERVKAAPRTKSAIAFLISLLSPGAND